MNVYNYGSINIDHIYRVTDFVSPGETLASKHYQRMLGGKGANQSIALAKAGIKVKHIGSINSDDAWVKDSLVNKGISTEYIQQLQAPTGHAIIQVSDAGENAIILHGGANHAHSLTDLELILSNAKKGDVILLQNECNLTDSVLSLSKEKGLTVVFNPAPMTDEVSTYALTNVDYLIVNETEAEALLNDPAFNQTQAHALIDQLHHLYPEQKIIMTLGADGVLYKDKQHTFTIAAEKVEVVDTTAAGDTFIGYFIQQIITGKSIETALKVANKASSITVQTLGASESIPDMSTIQSLGLTR